MLSVPVLLLSIYSLVLFTVGTGTITRLVRWLCDVNRRFAARSGVQVETPYRPEPEFRADAVGWRSRSRWILADPATWRDLSWLLFNTVVGMIGLIPAAGLYYVLEGLVMAGGLWRTVLRADGHGRWYLYVRVDSSETALIAAVLAIALFFVWALASPPILKAHAYFARSLLGPTRRAALASRVRHLAETRSDVLEAQAAELRRIERDLHDGAQARIVGLGMTLGAVERHLDNNPEEARRLLRVARESSVLALRELRNLVRGIHPPVLAERGLADALRALGIASPLKVEVAATISGELPKPVELTMYFAVSELLTNALKHSGAHHVDIKVWHEPGVLRAQVADDGHGGANDNSSAGLAGIRGRLATFDGAMEIESPPGGPTAIKLEIPCALSSRKTSIS
jgi:signal transduction histidine kinase